MSHWLKFDPADANQGVFFIAANGSATKVDVVDKNKPGEMMFLVSALAAGDYILEASSWAQGLDRICSPLDDLLREEGDSRGEEE